MCSFKTWADRKWRHAKLLGSGGMEYFNDVNNEATVQIGTREIIRAFEQGAALHDK